MLCRVLMFVLFPGLGGCGDYAGSLCKWPTHLQRQVADQQIRLAQNPQNLLQEEQLLHQNPARRGKDNSYEDTGNEFLAAADMNFKPF